MEYISMDIFNLQCVYCKNKAKYSYSFNNAPEYCEKHKGPYMISSNNRNSYYINVKKELNNQKKEISKVIEKNNNNQSSIEKQNDLCVSKNCNNKALFRVNIDHKPLYCRKHCLPLMVATYKIKKT